MRKLINLIFLLIISFSGYSQIDYSIFLQKKISKKDRISFTNMAKFKKHNYSKCLKGNCKNGKSLLKQSFLKSKKNNVKVIHTILIEGMFKNGKLNGEAAIFYYSNFYYNEKAKDNGVFSNNRDILTNTNYSEYIKGNFKDNVVTKGEYKIKVRNRSNKTILMDIVSKLDFITYFSDWDISKFSSDIFSQSLYSYKYKGNFESLSVINTNQFKKLELFYTTRYNTNVDNKYTITIKPSERENTYTFTQKLQTYSKTTNTKAKSFSIINGECDGCWLSDMTLDEHKEYVINETQKNKTHTELLEKQKIAQKVIRAKSFVGHFVTKYSHYYYINNYDYKGCIYGNVYPTKSRKDKNYIYFYNDCSPEEFKIANHIGVCPNCDGWGTESAEIIYNTKHSTVNNAGIKVGDSYTTVTNSGKYQDIQCHVCGGDGVIINKN